MEYYTRRKEAIKVIEQLCKKELDVISVKYQIAKLYGYADRFVVKILNDMKLSNEISIDTNGAIRWLAGGGLNDY